MANKKLVMKLLIDSNSNKVLFAEVGKDVVDFLFGLLALPVASIVNLLSKTQLLSSMDKLYQSLEGLDVAYIQPGLNKTDLLNFVASSPSCTQSRLLLPGSTPDQKYYKCFCTGTSLYNIHFTDGYGTPCPTCKRQMTTQLSYVSPKTTAEGVGSVGFVKDAATYAVMDDLTVTMVSCATSTITLLKHLKVSDMAAVEEKSVELGYDEGVELLKASLILKRVLTHVFLRGKVG